MRKLILFFPLVFFAIYSDAQQKYRCEFADTMISVIPDSLFRFLASKNNLSGKATEQFLEQQRTNPVSKYYLKIVRAGKDQTIISLDKHSISGNLTIKIFDSLLYKNDELFNEAPTSSGFSEKPWDRPKKAFRGTGKKLTILDYQCDEYLSTDSTCYIWVSTELPAYINPGARTNNVKGAVLGFRLTYTTTSTISMLVKLEKIL
jgi:hypothetical protein